MVEPKVTIEITAGGVQVHVDGLSQSRLTDRHLRYQQSRGVFNVTRELDSLIETHPELFEQLALVDYNRDLLTISNILFASKCPSHEVAIPAPES